MSEPKKTVTAVVSPDDIESRATAWVRANFNARQVAALRLYLSLIDAQSKRTPEAWADVENDLANAVSQ